MNEKFVYQVGNNKKAVVMSLCTVSWLIKTVLSQFRIVMNEMMHI